MKLLFVHAAEIGKIPGIDAEYLFSVKTSPSPMTVTRCEMKEITITSRVPAENDENRSVSFFEKTPDKSMSVRPEKADTMIRNNMRMIVLTIGLFPVRSSFSHP